MRLHLSLILAIASSTGCWWPESDDDDGAPCEVGNETYPSGANGIPAPDGCNTCSCTDGELQCTLLGCPDECVVDGKSYPSGTANIPAPDGCNTCTCLNGEITACTEIACLPAAACIVNGKTYASGSSGIKDPFSCNQCACDDGQLVCTDAHCPENECPPNSVPGRSCAQCGPTDACEAYEFGCLIVCESDDHCPTETTRDRCVEGTCRTQCG